MHTLSLLRAGQLAGSQRLDLSCQLKEFPAEIFDLADTLEILNLSGNALSSLPDDLGRLHKLRVLFCSDNQFTALPEVLGQCRQLSMVGFKANRIREVPAATFTDALTQSLRWLILTDNQISSLPAELGLCTRLQKLMLSGNQLQQLPAQMAACTELELLRIAANRLSSLPECVLSLPKLAWLAYAGNPFSDSSAAIAQKKIADRRHAIEWQQLVLQQQLGEGASGIIYQATWQNASVSQPVAVKLFKGALTSDGLPASEMAACMSAGVHANLIGVNGQIGDHPSGVTGLVMSLIDSSYRNLAAPPSLASCTRDIYPDDSQFTLESALRIARGIASAARHLHAQGLLHGDLYAHNILHNGLGDCLLGDFGAASFFSQENQAQIHALQRIEVRAFACLLEELLQRCLVSSGQQHAYKTMLALQARCAQSDNAARPLFVEIEQELTSIQP